MNKIKQSILGPSGFTHTSNELYDYIVKLVADIKNKLPCTNKISACLWSYRHDGYPCVSLDIQEDNHDYTMTMTVSGTADYGILDEPDFEDLAELMHMIGILSNSLNIEIEIGLTKNEVNQDVVSAPFFDGQTNGKIKLID